MSGIMQYEFHLFGPRKGQTLTINGHHFRNGVALLAYSSEAMGSCIKVLGAYGAYARGTREFLDAEEREAKEKAANGASEVFEASDVGQNDEVRSGVRPSGQRPTPQASDDGAGSGDAEGSDGSSASSNRDGHEHAGIPKFPEDKDHQPVEPPSEVNEAIKTAMMKLDPEVDSHWVMTGARKGMPKLNAVEEAYGKTGLTIQDLAAAAPEWTRDVARQAVADMFGG